MGLFDQKSKTTETKTITGASGNEALLNDLFTKLAQQAGGSLSDFSGGVGVPNAQDQQLVDQSIGASGDMARRQLERTIQQLMAQMSESLGARGIQNSSIEAVGAGQIGSQGLQSIADSLSQQQMQGGQALMNLPFQRGQLELEQNAQLLQRLAGLGGAVQQGGLQERLNTIGTTTETSTSPGLGGLMQMGAGFAGPLGQLGAQLFGGGGQTDYMAAFNKGHGQ